MLGGRAFQKKVGHYAGGTREGICDAFVGAEAEHSAAEADEGRENGNMTAVMVRQADLVTGRSWDMGWR